MIDLIIFDLDGVLINKEIHFRALNVALAKYANLTLTEEEHEDQYDGRPTIQKLKLLHENKGLDAALYDKIWKEKQRVTDLLLDDIKPDGKMLNMFGQLSKICKLALASNAIRHTVDKVLYHLMIEDYMKPIISNEDIRHAKPYPECYWKCMEYHKILPENTLIIEDSPIGIEGANNSGAHVYECITQEYLDFNKILNYILCL